MGFEEKEWFKIGIRIVSKPAAHGSGLYLRIPKKTVDAYGLWNSEVIEFTVERALKKKPTEEVTT
jgi:hypothetical protein